MQLRHLLDEVTRIRHSEEQHRSLYILRIIQPTVSEILPFSQIHKVFTIFIKKNPQAL